MMVPVFFFDCFYMRRRLSPRLWRKVLHLPLVLKCKTLLFSCVLSTRTWLRQRHCWGHNIRQATNASQDRNGGCCSTRRKRTPWGPRAASITRFLYDHWRGYEIIKFQINQETYNWVYVFPNSFLCVWNCGASLSTSRRWNIRTGDELTGFYMWNTIWFLTICAPHVA